MKKKIIIFSTILLVVIVSFFIGTTYSKYIAQVKGDGIADVAKWSFKVNGTPGQFKTINLAQTCNQATLVNNKIAPGTSGSFDIIIDTTEAEVGTNYQTTFSNEQNKPSNLKFIYNNKEYNTLKEMETQLMGTINANDINKIKSYSIDWKWDYENGESATDKTLNDLKDTNDGIIIDNYTFSIKVIGTQAKPNI